MHAFEISVLTWLRKFLSVRRQFIYIHDIDLIKIYISNKRRDNRGKSSRFQKIAGSICWFDGGRQHTFPRAAALSQELFINAFRINSLD